MLLLHWWWYSWWRWWTVVHLQLQIGYLSMPASSTTVEPVLKLWNHRHIKSAQMSARTMWALLSRPSLAAGATTHSVQAGHDGVQVPSSHGAVVPSRHVHSCVVYNWSSASPFCRPSRSDNSTQSIGAIWITQLRRFRPFGLELVASCHWLFATWALHSLVSVVDLKLNCISKHMMDIQHLRDRYL